MGVAVAVPVCVAIFGFAIPWLAGAILGGARDLDDKLAQQAEYMTRVCGEALVVERDQTLCGCVLAAEFPALDCQDRFRQWSLDRQAAKCSVADVKKASLSYCTCIETVAELVAKAENEDDARRELQAYDRCLPLPDARALPTIESLAPRP